MKASPLELDVQEFDVKHLEDSLVEQFLSAGHWDQLIGLTILLNDRVGAIMGISPVWDGVYDVVFIPGRVFPKNKKTVYRYVKLWLEGLHEHVDWHRLQVTTDMRKPEHQRFIEFLGFEREGVLRAYSSDGHDVVVSSIVREV